MTVRTGLPLFFLLATIAVTSRHALAAGGTSVIADKGRPTSVSPGWPEGVGDLVNDSSRTTGWNSWFTEWPNDVNQYAFEIKSTEELNSLIAKLAAIKADLKQIRLSHLKEPNGLGWVSSVPEGNGIAVIFSIDDQARIDEWFKRVRKPFGKIEFTATPVAVPPTLTVFVQNESIKIDELKIPEGIDVSVGYVPTVFHKANTTAEQQQEKEVVKKELEGARKELDDASLAAMKKIQAFVDSRNSKKPR